MFELKLEIGKEIRKGIQTQQANQTRPENPTAHPTLLSPKPSLSKPHGPAFFPPAAFPTPRRGPFSSLACSAPRPSVSPLTPAGPANQPPACSHASAGPSRPHSLSPLRDADRPGPPASAAHSARRTPRVSPDGPVPHASAHTRTLSPTRCHAGPARQRPSLPFRPGSAQRPPGITGEAAGIPIPPQSPALPFLTPAAPLRRHPIPLAPHKP